MKWRNGRHLRQPLFNWLSSISVGLIVGGILAIMVSNNPLGFWTAYLGAATAFILFYYTEDES